MDANQIRGTNSFLKSNPFSNSQEIPAFYGTRNLITPFTSARHLSLLSGRAIQPMPPHPIYWKSIILLSSHLHAVLPCGLFPFGLLTTETAWNIL